MLDSGQNRHGLRPSRYSRSRTSLAWRRILRRAPPAGTGTGDQPTPRRVATSNNGESDNVKVFGGEIYSFYTSHFVNGRRCMSECALLVLHHIDVWSKKGAM